MDLLNKYISNIPMDEQLVAMYIIDGNTQFAATKLLTNEFNLYSVSNYQLIGFETSSNTLGKFDTFVADKLVHHITFQSAITNTDNIRIVTYKTDSISITKPTSERQEISRFVHNHKRKLF